MSDSHKHSIDSLEKQIAEKIPMPDDGNLIGTMREYLPGEEVSAEEVSQAQDMMKMLGVSVTAPEAPKYPEDLPENPQEKKGVTEEDEEIDPEDDFSMPTWEGGAVNNLEDLEKFLSLAGLNAETTLALILNDASMANDPKVQHDVWEAHAREKGFEPADVHAAIHEFISNDCLKKNYELFGGRWQMRLTSRNLRVDNFIIAQRNAEVAALENASDLERHRIHSKWYLIGAMDFLTGPENHPRKYFQGHPTKEIAAEWAEFFDGLSTFKFEAMYNKVIELDTLAMLASQKMSIENF